MIKVSTVGIAGGTLILAAGAGLYMQMTAPAADQPQVAALSSPLTSAPSLAPAPEVTASAAPDIAPRIVVEEPGQTPLELDAITLMSSDLPLPPVPKSMTDAAPALWDADPADVVPTPAAIDPIDLPQPDVDPMQTPIDAPTEGPAQADTAPQELTADDCLVDMTGETRAAAMVALTLSAPCNAEQQVTLRHDGMVFTAMTDAAGQLSIIVPALSETATFLAMLEDGNGAAVEMEVDTLGFYDRSVVQWQGDSGVELHALEYGAAWDSEGHVWSGAPRDAAVAARGEGGFLTRLGSVDTPDAKLAEVYTFPTGTAKTAGAVTLSVEVEVTEANCGRDLRAHVIEVDDARAGTPGELSLTVPGCDAVGDFIQLKNLVTDLKIAAR